MAEMDPALPADALKRARAAIVYANTKALASLIQRHGQQLLHADPTLVNLAVAERKAACVSLLLDAGAEADACDEEGRTPFFFIAVKWAMGAKATQVMRALVAKGANVNHRDRYGRVALAYAARGGVGVIEDMRRRRIATLLALGADPRIRDHAGKRPIDYAGMVPSGGGGEWLLQLPASARGLQLCRDMLQAEMDRRDNREILQAVRQRAEAAARAAAAAERDEAKGGANEWEEEQEGGDEDVPVPVERRLVALPDSFMFARVVEFL